MQTLLLEEGVALTTDTLASLASLEAMPMDGGTQLERIFSHIAENVHQYDDELVMCCPFRAERTPSFGYNTETSAWYCFGCHVSGCGLEPLLRKLGYRGKVLLDLLSGVTEIVHAQKAQRNTTAAQAADLRYAQEMAASYEDWDSPSLEQVYLMNRNFFASTLNYWHVRIIPGVEHHSLLVPILYNGRVLGYQRRAVRRGEKPKYLNMTGLKKHLLLYGECRRGRVLLCEGVTDVWMAHQRGETSVVSTLGSAISREQYVLLREHATSIICAYHFDEAGEEGWLRLLEMAHVDGIPCVRLPLWRGDIAESTHDAYYSALHAAVQALAPHDPRIS